MPMSHRRGFLPSLLLLFLPFAAAAGLAAQVPAPAGQAAGSASASPASQALPAREPRIILPERIRQGDPLLAWIASSLPLEGATVELLRNGPAPLKAPLFAHPEPPAGLLYGALFALPFDLEPGPHVLRLRGRIAGQSFEVAAGLEVEARAWASEDIPLDAANTAIRSQSDARKEAEARILQAIYARVDPAAVFLDAPFLPPVGEARRSAGFGDRRRYLYSGGGMDASVHAGADFAVPVGTPVRATARGRVAFGGERVVTGGTVVLEHLPGLYSVYMHLQAVSVPLASVVERGEIIGLSGVSGLATGPHLHWELRAGGLPVDPDFWTRSPPIDKDRIIRTIGGSIEGR